jgi:hypothetical protein
VALGQWVRFLSQYISSPSLQYDPTNIPHTFICHRSYMNLVFESVVKQKYPQAPFSPCWWSWLAANILYVFRHTLPRTAPASRLLCSAHPLHLTLSLLMSYIYGALCKARNFNIVWNGPTFGNTESRLFLFASQCSNTESMQNVFLWHSCV